MSSDDYKEEIVLWKMMELETIILNKELRKTISCFLTSEIYINFFLYEMESHIVAKVGCKPEANPSCLIDFPCTTMLHMRVPYIFTF